jgi:hypothetical protein
MRRHANSQTRTILYPANDGADSVTDGHPQRRTDITCRFYSKMCLYCPAMTLRFELKTMLV